MNRGDLDCKLDLMLKELARLKTAAQDIGDVANEVAEELARLNKLIEEDRDERLGRALLAAAPVDK